MTGGIEPTAQPQPERGAGALVVISYIMALLMPVIGFVLGIVLLIRRQTVHGLIVFCLSIAVGIAACAALVNDAEEELSAYSECVERAQTLKQMNRC